MKLGIITGSGTYSLPGFEDADVLEIGTRFGAVTVTSGRFAGADVLHIARHGEGHRYISSQVNHRAHALALKECGADAVLAVTVCGALDPAMELGTLIVFDDLHFLVNRLADGSLCTVWTEPGMKGRGHFIFHGGPFSEPLRAALLAGAADAGRPVRDGGCYGHVDGPRFNSPTEIRMLQQCGVTAVSQTAGPETVLFGELDIPYALLGFATDYANEVAEEQTPVEELIRLIALSSDSFATTLAAAVLHLPPAEDLSPVGTHFRFD
jgi:purine nucleoside phosphorylase